VLIAHHASSTALHPYYKLAYIELAWGGAKEQEAEFEAGNFSAKNWQDEARKILEKTVSNIAASPLALNVYFTDGAVLENAAKYYWLNPQPFSCRCGNSRTNR
jgi:hypothetical protein